MPQQPWQCRASCAVRNSCPEGQPLHVRPLPQPRAYGTYAACTTHRGTGGDSLSEARWYRVTGQAGSRLLSEPPDPDVSGTFACAYHDGWLRTQHPQPYAPLADAVVCFTVPLPTVHPTPPSPSCRPHHPAPAYPLTPRCLSPLHLHLSLHPTCTTQQHLTRTSHTSPAPHPHLTLALRPPVRQTADYPSTTVRGRDAIDSCDRQVVVMGDSSELEVVADIVCGGSSSSSSLWWWWWRGVTAW